MTALLGFAKLARPSMPLIVPALMAIVIGAPPLVGVSVRFAPPPGYVKVARLPVLLNVAVPLPSGVTGAVGHVAAQSQAPVPVLVNVSVTLCGVPVLS